jgi:hypothetical protein
MAEFLHQVIKKREREMEMRGLLDFDSQIFVRSRGESQRGSRVPERHVFSTPPRPLPPATEITYRSNPNNGVIEHSVIFPNVGSWIQSAVMINTPPSVTVRSPQLLAIIGWDLLAGHPCRPNYSWSDNTYTCRTCSGTYTTDGSEWQHG